MKTEELQAVAERIGASVVSFAACAERGPGEEAEDIAAEVLQRAARFIEWSMLLESVRVIDNKLVFVNVAGAVIAPAASLGAFRPRHKEEREELAKLRARFGLNGKTLRRSHGPGRACVPAGR